MATATLLIVEGIGQGTRFQIGRRRAGVGRGADNAVRLPDSEASRFHAAIEWAESGFVLSDLGSVNGTFLNGAQIDRQRIVDGDQFQVGQTVLLFRVVGAGSGKTLPVDLVGGTEDRPSIESSVDPPGVRSPTAATETGSKNSAESLVGRSSDLAGVAESTEAEALASLAALYRISEEVADPAATLETILQGILDVALEVVSADRGCVLMVSPESGVPVPRVYRGRGQVMGSGSADATMPVPRSIVDVVLTQGHGVRTSDAQQDDRFSGGRSILQAGVREAVCAPLVGRQSVLGVIYLDTTTDVADVMKASLPDGRLTEESLRLLVAIGRHAGLAIDGQRSQQALVKAERLAAVGQAIAALSHHIKNILQGVRGGSYLINLGLKDHDEKLIEKGWGIVDRNQGRIYDLVMDMLTYSTDRLPAWKYADVDRIVADVCELLQARAGETHVCLQCDLSERPSEADCDPEGIHRAVLNVVVNAIDAVEGRPGARVSVTTGIDSSAEWVFIDVEDNGTGVPEAEMPRLFTIFESSKGARGTGLGLAVSRKIIGEHGGEIQVENSPGAGCRFRLTWPLRADGLGEPDEGSEASAE
ncbi:MAG: ATP-binding protein [Planctomycetaceae bacterium]